MTCLELYNKLNAQIPTSMSCSWDHDGLMCCPEPDREVRKVLVALDATGAVVEEAIRGHYDAIVTHHPMLFKGLKDVVATEPIAAKTMDLIRAGISVMCFHTRLDALDDGVNDCLAKVLHLQSVEKFGSDSIPLGRVGYLKEPISLKEFSQQIKEALGCPFVLVADAGKIVHKVAVVGGEGKDEMQAALAAGADTFVSGRLGYHYMTDAAEGGLNLIEAGHFWTENPVCEQLASWIKNWDNQMTVNIYHSNRIITM